MANEFSKGTLINIVSKGLRRSTIILSKFTMAAMTWTVSYLLGLAIAWAYTSCYFTAENISNAFLAFFSLWLFGVFLIALLILGGVLFQSIFARKVPLDFLPAVTICGALMIMTIFAEIMLFNKKKYDI